MQNLDGRIEDIGSCLHISVDVEAKTILLLDVEGATLHAARETARTAQFIVVGATKNATL